ncbi:hypothetical protein HNY73_021806 [Argiope bruennichi]|uniref:Uncharacterized protein n=1 Tax=Argiope bruennichi TaxID=94029 RepID=A0A8T0DZQ6_ARGBR|nr:hypothetical protein HNY73_021806 [Argiope bruennichi]
MKLNQKLKDLETSILSVSCNPLVPFPSSVNQSISYPFYKEGKEAPNEIELCFFENTFCVSLIVTKVPVEWNKKEPKSLSKKVLSQTNCTESAEKAKERIISKNFEKINERSNHLLKPFTMPSMERWFVPTSSFCNTLSAIEDESVSNPEISSILGIMSFFSGATVLVKYLQNDLLESYGNKLYNLLVEIGDELCIPLKPDDDSLGDPFDSASPVSLTEIASSVSSATLSLISSQRHHVLKTDFVPDTPTPKQNLSRLQRRKSQLGLHSDNDEVLGSTPSKSTKVSGTKNYPSCSSAQYTPESKRRLSLKLFSKTLNDCDSKSNDVPSKMRDSPPHFESQNIEKGTISSGESDISISGSVSTVTFPNTIERRWCNIPRKTEREPYPVHVVRPRLSIQMKEKPSKENFKVVQKGNFFEIVSSTPKNDKVWK